jgi:predicted membrane protein
MSCVRAYSLRPQKGVFPTFLESQTFLTLTKFLQKNINVYQAKRYMMKIYVIMNLMPLILWHNYWCLLFKHGQTSKF